MKNESKSRGLNLRSSLSVLLVCLWSLGGWSITLTRSTHAQVEQGDKGVRLVTQLPTREKRWALIVGIDEYEREISSLKGAVNDAKALKNVLVKHAGFPENQVIILTTGAGVPDQLPRRSNILDELNNLSNRVPEDGLLLFSFSGHGVSIENQAYLIPSDGRITKNLNLLRDFSIDVQRIKEAIKEIKVRQVLMLLDACRNEFGKGAAANLLTEAYKRGFSFDVTNSDIKSFATLYATSIGERAFEFYDKTTNQHRGYFSFAIEEGLKGKAANENGEITLSSLMRYVENSVPKRVRFDMGEKQEPFNEIAGYKASELILSKVQANSNTKLSSDKVNSDDSNLSADSKMESESAIQEVSFNYLTTKQLTIGKGDFEFTTSWSGCANNCIYSYSDRLAGLANSKATTFDKINDYTSYDMSSRARRAKKNEILILKNKAGYYALVQIAKVSYDGAMESNNMLTIRYRIIPYKLQSTWRPSPEKYISQSMAGRVKFDFSDNSGIFTIGKGDFEFVMFWDGGGIHCARIYKDRIKSVAVVPVNAVIRTAKDAQNLQKSERTVILSAGQRAVLENSKGKYALIKVISAETEDYYSKVNDVVFDYEILPD